MMPVAAFPPSFKGFGRVEDEMEFRGEKRSTDLDKNVCRNVLPKANQNFQVFWVAKERVFIAPEVHVLNRGVNDGTDLPAGMVPQVIS